MSAAFLGDDGVTGKMSVQSLDDELFRRAIGFSYKIVLALELKTDVALEVAMQKRTGFVRNAGGGFQIIRV
jgi:hypothetical protein